MSEKFDYENVVLSLLREFKIETAALFGFDEDFTKLLSEVCCFTRVFDIGNSDRFEESLWDQGINLLPNEVDFNGFESVDSIIQEFEDFNLAFDLAVVRNEDSKRGLITDYLLTSDNKIILLPDYEEGISFGYNGLQWRKFTPALFESSTDSKSLMVLYRDPMIFVNAEGYQCTH